MSDILDREQLAGGSLAWRTGSPARKVEALQRTALAYLDERDALTEKLIHLEAQLDLIDVLHTAALLGESTDVMQRVSARFIRWRDEPTTRPEELQESIEQRPAQLAAEDRKTFRKIPDAGPPQHWCMCTEVDIVARDMWATCGQCGGQDAYKRSKGRPQEGTE